MGIGGPVGVGMDLPHSLPQPGTVRGVASVEVQFLGGGGRWRERRRRLECAHGARYIRLTASNGHLGYPRTPFSARTAFPGDPGGRTLDACAPPATPRAPRTPTCIRAARREP